MSPRYCFTAFFLLMLFFSARSTQANDKSTNLATAVDNDLVLFHNATLIDPASQQYTKNGWLLVKHGKIVQQGQHSSHHSLPRAARAIDLQQQYVLPGLIDVHLHLTAGPHRVEILDGHPVLTMKGHEEVTRYHALSTLASGITTAFSPAGDPEENARYATAQKIGQWRGPQLFYTGYVFDPTTVIGGSIYPKNEAAWRNEIQRQKALGVRAIKLYTGLNQDEVTLGVRLAQSAGLKSVAHLDNVSWQFAAEQGIDALTHALPTSADLLTGVARTDYLEQRRNPLDQRFLYRWFAQVDYDSEPMQRLFSTLSRQQTRVDLTLVVNEIFYFSRELERLYPDANLWVFHPETRRRWRATMAAPSYDWTPRDFLSAQQQMPKVQELLKRLFEAGVPLAIGTDSFASGPFYLRELQLSKAAGLDHWQVLQLATSGGAQHLGLADHGQLKAGFVADFIVLKQSPLDDLSALQQVQIVVQRGIPHTVDALRAELPSLSHHKF